MARIVLARELIGALIDAGLVPDTTRRVVIDATVDDALLVYAEVYGGDEMIKVLVPGLMGTKVQIIGETDAS